jgi:hypothetical protein
MTKQTVLSLNEIKKALINCTDSRGKLKAVPQEVKTAILTHSKCSGRKNLAVVLGITISQMDHLLLKPKTGKAGEHSNLMPMSMGKNHGFLVLPPSLAQATSPQFSNDSKVHLSIKGGNGKVMKVTVTMKTQSQWEQLFAGWLGAQRQGGQS